MTILSLNVFKGMWPRSSRQQLPPAGSELAVNAELLSGDLRALRSSLTGPTIASLGVLRAAFRVPAALRDDVPDPPPASDPDDLNDVWVGFETEFTHFVKGPLVNDKYSRWYWTEEGQRPRYAALADLVTGGPNGGADPYYILGVPAPFHTEPDPDAEPPEEGDMFTVVASGGTDDLKETRCYVYTFINEYGEESAPSLPVCAEGNGDGTWTLSGLKTAFVEPWLTEGNPIEKQRIYRTITGETGGSFFFVDEISPPAASYVDDIGTDEVSLNTQLESDAWKTPPEDLVGVLRHPNGFLVGFSKGGNLHFSTPYRPHAWPAEYTLSTEGEIQALGVFGTSVVAATNAHPYVATGTNPAGITLTKTDTSLPCVSRFSIVSMDAGVTYASPDGIAGVGPNGVGNITEQVIARGEWSSRYDPSFIRATRFGFRYLSVALHDDEDILRRGLVYAPKEPASIWSEVAFRLQQQFTSLQTDLYSGTPYSLVGNIIQWLGESMAFPEQYTWRSTEFVTADPCNFGAYRIDFDPIIRYPEQSPDSDKLEQFESWNKERITSPLDTLDLYPINGVHQAVIPPPSDVLPQNRQPLGGSPLYDLQALGAATVTVTLYGNRVVRYTKELSEPGIYRLPSGYKTDLWQVEFSGNADLHHFKMAETGKELRRA